MGQRFGPVPVQCKADEQRLERILVVSWRSHGVGIPSSKRRIRLEKTEV